MTRSTLTALALGLAAAAPARAQQAVNPIHPTFIPLDANGKRAAASDRVSADRTCGGCHDAAWIGGHSGHAPPRSSASCLDCHVDGGRLELRVQPDGRLVREAIRIGSPGAGSCARCHGLVAPAQGALALPPGFPAAGDGRTWSLTLGEGAVVSPQRMSDAFLDLEGKEDLAAPWDVHAAKLVGCTACHAAANDPAQAEQKRVALRYLTADPRRPSKAEFLVRPDHRLTEKDCRSCHDPLQAHGFLPYRERHMAVLSCAACHVPGPMGLAAEMVDETVVTAGGRPLVRYRNVELHAGETLDTATLRPLRPLVLERVERDGARRLAPVNTVSRFRWVGGAARAPVAPALVARAFLEQGRYAPAVVAAFDADGDGRVDEAELRLDAPAKVALIERRLAALGVADPAIEGAIEVYPLAHGVSTKDRALRACTACHGADSRLAGSYVVASYLPGGKPPRPREGTRVELAGVLSPMTGGGLVLGRRADDAPGALHVLGLSRNRTVNAVGFGLFLALSLGLLAHALTRVALRERRARRLRETPAPTAKAYAFGRYERIWHWTMALSVVVLILSGLAIHLPGARWAPDLPTAVSLHNVFSAVLLVNAALSLFHHLTTSAIRNFIPRPRGLLKDVLAHLEYQSRGIFFGRPHPANPPGRKLNPLQQLTYLVILNLLFPLQVVTGALIWAVGRWPELAPALGGLRYLAPAHALGSWLFLSFFVLHVYLVTTGRTPTEHLESMITGFQAVHGEEHAQ